MEAARAVNAGLAVTAVFVLVGALVLRLAFLVPLAVALLGGEYALVLLLDVEGLDARAPLVAAALFVAAELASWALELRDAVADEAGMLLRRVSFLAGTAVGVTALGLALLTLVELAGTGGGALELLGAAAAVAALGLLAVAARRGGRAERS